MSASKVQWPELSQLSLCSEFDKENSMEFSLISLPTYILYYCDYALILPWSSCYSSHVTVTWPSVTLWQSHVILSHAPPCSCKSKEKEKEKKRNINNDLAILPSHDSSYQLICLISRPLLIALRRDWHQSKGLLKGFKLALRLWESSKIWWRYDQMKFVTARILWEWSNRKYTR